MYGREHLKPRIGAVAPLLILELDYCWQLTAFVTRTLSSISDSTSLYVEKIELTQLIQVVWAAYNLIQPLFNLLKVSFGIRHLHQGLVPLWEKAACSTCLGVRMCWEEDLIWRGTGRRGNGGDGNGLGTGEA